MWLDSQDGHEGASNRVPGKQKYSQFHHLRRESTAPYSSTCGENKMGKEGWSVSWALKTIRVHKPYWPRWQVTTDTVCQLENFGWACWKKAAEWGYLGTKTLLLSLKVDTAFLWGWTVPPPAPLINLHSTCSRKLSAQQAVSLSGDHREIASLRSLQAVNPVLFLNNFYQKASSPTSAAVPLQAFRTATLEPLVVI